MLRGDSYLATSSCRNDIEKYYTEAQAERTRNGYDTAAMNIDDYWWMSNFLLSVTQSSSRYDNAAREFIAAWTLVRPTKAEAEALESFGATSRKKVRF